MFLHWLRLLKPNWLKPVDWLVSVASLKEIRVNRAFPVPRWVSNKASNKANNKVSKVMLKLMAVATTAITSTP